MSAKDAAISTNYGDILVINKADKCSEMNTTDTIEQICIETELKLNIQH